MTPIRPALSDLLQRALVNSVQGSLNAGYEVAVAGKQGGSRW